MIALVLQVLGGAVAVVGVGLLSVPAALIVAGALLVVFGVAVERG